MSDELLVGLLDEELPFHQRWLVRRHLRGCWECRARQADLESSIARLVELKRAHAMRESDSLRKSLQHFDCWRTAYEQQADSPPKPFSAAPRYRVAVALAAAVLVGLAAFLWRPQPGANPQSEQPAFLQAREVEQLFLSSEVAVRQKFRIEIAELKPVAQERQSSLELWADGPGHRYTATWTSSDGGLQYGAWQPAADRRYELDPSQAHRIVSVSADTAHRNGRLADYLVDAAEVRSLEARFLQWLQSRRWAPVLLTEDFAGFRSGSASRLVVQRLGSSGGVPVHRIVAQTRARGVDVEVVLEVDAKTYHARLQEIRLRDGEREALVKIVVEEVRVLGEQEVRLNVAVFEPRLDEKDTRTAGLRAARPAMFRIVPPPVRDDSLEGRVQLLDLLHRIGAEVGEELAVGRRPDGGLIIEGIVDSARRREHITSLVEKLIGNEAVTLRIVDTETGWTSPDPVPSLLGWRAPPLPGAADAQTLPIGALVESYVRENLPEETAKNYLKRMAELHWSLMSEAWSLRMLSHAILPWEETRLSASSRATMHNLVEEHRRSLRMYARELDSFVSPLLDDERDRDRCASAPSGNWQTEADWLFRECQSLSSELQELVTPGRDSAPDLSPSQRLQRIRAVLSCLAPPEP